MPRVAIAHGSTLPYLVMSRVDYGNALLFGLPEMQLHNLQMIQNSAARLVTGTHGRDHITPVLFKLHWLPVRYRIEFKLLVLVYQAVHHLGPAYLTSLVTPYAPARSLRSAAHRSLTIPRYNLERYGRRAFSVAGPSLWNNLPVTIREAGTLDRQTDRHIYSTKCTSKQVVQVNNCAR